MNMNYLEVNGNGIPRNRWNQWIPRNISFPLGHGNRDAPYYINEEEIPRTGAVVQRSFQRSRWLNGKTYLRIGRDKETGKGEGWTNLQFDQIVNIPQNIK